jgi:alpha-ribazole phosphatase
MMELWLVRHAESEGNVSGKHDDSSLTVLGRRQAESLRAVLSAVSFDAVFSSDLLRCIETATLALPKTAIRQDPRIREMQEGPKECFVDLGKLSSQEMLAFLQKNAAPAEESGLSFRARIHDWLNSLPVQGKLLAFTHTLVIREILRLRLAPSGSRAPHAIDNASLTRLEFNQQETRILSLNETQHLK